MVCSFVTTILSFFPIRFLRRIFRPWIAGTTVFLVGVTLVGAGPENWGGGDACASGTSLCKGNGSVQLPYGSPQYLVRLASLPDCELRIKDSVEA